MSLKINDISINRISINDINIKKAYLNNKVVFLGYDRGVTPHTGPCYAVVNDINDYSDTTYDDVFDKKTNKWYKLNNLNEYEEYGVYGTSITDETYYKGKLSIVDDIEYQWNGNSWIEVGKNESQSTVIKSPEYLERVSNSSSYIDLDTTWTLNTKVEFKYNCQNGGGGNVIGDVTDDDNDDLRMFFFGSSCYFDWGTSRLYQSNILSNNSDAVYEIGNYYVNNLTLGASMTSTTKTSTNEYHLYHYRPQSSTDAGYTYYIKIYESDELIRDFIPYIDDDGNVGLYDKIQNTYHMPIGQMYASPVINDVTVIQTLPTVKYDKKDAPPNKITFSSVDELNNYECPYVGMMAIVGDTYYKYTEDFEWVEMESYYEVDLNNEQWVPSTSYGNITDIEKYDFYQSDKSYHVGNGKDMMFIHIFGYDTFTFKVRNYSESTYDYVVVNNIDDTSSPKWQPNEGIGLASDGRVYYRNYGKSSSAVWYDVTFYNLNKEEHVITITYGKDNFGENDDDRGYVAIPKKIADNDNDNDDNDNDGLKLFIEDLNNPNNVYELKCTSDTKLSTSETEEGINRIGGTNLKVVIGGCVRSIDAYQFRENYGSKIYELIIEEGVEYIGHEAFMGLQIQTLTLPSTIKTIEFWAFTRLKNMTECILLSTEPPYLPTGAGRQ